MKTAIMLVDVAPIALSMAISLVFSITTITRVLMIFNAPTSTIMVRIMNMVIFSSLRAERRLLFMACQSLVQYG